MGRLAIRTNDFQLSFKLIEKLRADSLDFEVIDVNTPVHDDSIVWFSTPSEIVDFPAMGTPIPVDLDSIDSAVMSAVFQLKGPQESISLVIGIDPGPYPGIAWLVDGAFCGIMQLTSTKELMPNLIRLREIGSFVNITIKVGDGAPLIRDQIINDCIAENWVTEQVNENSTSSGLTRNNHSTSALRIATSNGTKIWQTRSIKPTQGDIKYIQTESRKRSNGKFTISQTVAAMVAVGEISMDEALAMRSSYSSEE